MAESSLESLQAEAVERCAAAGITDLGDKGKSSNPQPPTPHPD